MKKLLIISLLLISQFSFASIIKIYSADENQSITYEDFIKELPASGHIIMGEFHNDELIQKAQAKILSDKTLKEKLYNQVALHWEFLNYTDQISISKYYALFLQDKITAMEFLTKTAGTKNSSYSVIFEELKLRRGKIIGINLPRKIKQQVISGGIESVDPKYIPSHHYNGDNQYRERFVSAMGGHVPTSKIDAYFTAQCLTDSVMADKIALNSHNQLNFVIAGSFHTDFYNGTVVRLQKLLNSNLKTLKIINQNTITPEQLNQFLNGHPKYGKYADYIIVVK